MGTAKRLVVSGHIGSLERDFVASVNANGANPENFMKFLKALENEHVPIEAKVRLRLDELRTQMENLTACAKRGDRFLSKDEWLEYCKLAKRGDRIARVFSVDDSQSYFSTLYATAKCHLSATCTS